MENIIYIAFEDISRELNAKVLLALRAWISVWLLAKSISKSIKA